MKKQILSISGVVLAVTALLVVTSCASPTIPAAALSSKSTPVATTLATIVATGTGVTETSPILHFTAEYGTFTVTCSDGSASALSLSGSTWWTSGNGDTATTIADGATVTYTAKAAAAGTDFLVEVKNTAASLFVSTTSQLTAWGAGSYSGEASTGAEHTVAGNTYKVIVTRSGGDYTFQYIDMGAI